MDTRDVYTSKAEKYARYRWDYATEAIRTIFEITRISNQSVVADIGAGTGILTRHFTGKVGHVYVVEPNMEMRSCAENLLENCPQCSFVNGTSEETTLPDRSVDLITVAQAIHWFKAEPSKAEFLRIIKPGGWLVVLRNYGTDRDLNDAFGSLHSFVRERDDSRTVPSPPGKQADYYFAKDAYRKWVFPFELQETWEMYFGALCSYSVMPEEIDPLYDEVAMKAKTIFDSHSVNGYLTVRGETELILGQID